MRPTWLCLFFLLPWLAWSQPKHELLEYSGIVTSIEPGYMFALERLTLDVDGKAESFLFYPEYGELISKKISVGNRITLRANVDVGLKKQREEMSQRFKYRGWLFRDRITEIKIGDEWLRFDKPVEEKNDKAKNEKPEFHIFLDKKIKTVYSANGVKSGLVFWDGIAAYTEVLFTRTQTLKSAEPGGLISFVGRKLPRKNGYQYPVPDVKEPYWLIPLRKETGTLHSLLFKQNHACIGVKFKTSDSKDLLVSFPSEKAIDVNTFLKPDRDLTIYYGEMSDLERNNLPELHAIIQGRDTLFIKEYGFYGGPDSDHDHTDVAFEGKITRITKTPKGNITNIIVAPNFYVEIDAMLAQQFGQKLEKGKKIIIEGQERVKKIGEIYSKDYRIVSPKKITIDGTTFSSYQP